MKYFVAQKATIPPLPALWPEPFGLTMMIAESEIIAIEPWQFEGLKIRLLGFTQENHQKQGRLREGETGYILFGVISTEDPDFLDKAMEMVGG